jgi:hypothetical protein
MKTIEASTMILLLVLLPTIVSASAPTNFSFGGKSGDWIEYNLQNVIGLSGNEMERMEFLNVSGTAVTFRATVYTPTLTETNETYTLNLTSQEDFLMRFLSARVYFVPGGMGRGDSVYLGILFGARTIVGETTRSYLGVDRRVIYANLSDTEGNNYVFYWDKETGVLAEGTETYGSASYSVIVDATNMWASQIPLLIWISIIGAIALGVLSSRKTVMKKLRRKHGAQPVLKNAAFLHLPLKKGKVNRNARVLSVRA